MTPYEIKRTRKKLELTQTEFARLLGVHNMTVSKWERGRATPDHFQGMLISSFQKAYLKDPSVWKGLSTKLATDGVGVALYRLLRSAYGDEE